MTFISEKFGLFFELSNEAIGWIFAAVIVLGIVGIWHYIDRGKPTKKTIPPKHGENTPPAPNHNRTPHGGASNSTTI